MDADRLGSCLSAPAEGVQTALAVVVLLAFVLGIVSVGALYWAVLRRFHPERARDLLADARPEADPVPDDTSGLAPKFVLLLLRVAFAGRRHA